MSTLEDFESAPVGATATHPDGSRVIKTTGAICPWRTTNGIFLYDFEIGDYVLDPAPPWTVREALALAWNLAYPVKEGQHIPEGVRLLDRFDGNDFSVYTTLVGFTSNAREALTIRTLDPLPDPEPDWLDAPAVLATCGCRGIELWRLHDEIDGIWVSARGEHALWSSLRDVTPLYPREDV